MSQTKAWNKKADGYVTIITVLAVALFLFGLSLTIHRWIRFVFAAVGVFIAGLSFLWAVWIFFQPVSDMPEKAVQNYVEGVIQSNAAAWASDEKAREERTQAAIAAFSKAIEINPEYGRAYSQRAYTSEGGLEAATDYLAAIRYGKDDVFVHGNLGWEYYLVGDYRNALDETLIAVRMNPQVCTYHFNLGLIYLAMGRAREADAAYSEALQCAAASRADWRDWYLQQAALVDLQGLLEKQPGNEAARRWVVRVKEAIAAVALYKVYATFSFEGMTPDIPYYTVWYYNEAVDLATPYPSWEGGQSGTRWVRLWYEDGLPGGDWRLEIYVAGHLMASGEFTVEGPETIPQMADYVSAERGLALRYPVDWEKVEQPGKKGYVAFFKLNSKSLFLVTTIQLSGTVVPQEDNELFIARKKALLRQADPNVTFGDVEPFWLVGVEGREFAYQ